MTTHPGAGSVPPDDDTTSSSTDDGVPVGAADAEADARRSGASDDERPSDVGEGFLLDVDPGRSTDDGVPVGRADAEADRMRSGGDDDRV
ncbi:hypothetical protein [Geodermatophilus maliterrae]|uniref:Chemotaxis protein n=1 Tax=Geodermatophilus maliterrae TaxID=3162531 RepID=A0ABV3XPZ6_9ACTN